MSKTALSTTQVQSFSPQKLFPFQFFDLLGLDTYTPDELADSRRCVYGRNFRLFAPAATSKRTALAKRQGHIVYTTPAGETLRTQNTTTTGAADQSVGLISWVAQKFSAGATELITRIDLNIKNTASGTGPLIVELRNDNSGSPGTVMATSSLEQTAFTSSYAYYTARFIEAPAVTSGTSYWIVCYIQADGSNNYKWSSTTAATTAMTSSDAGQTWSSTSFAMNYKTYSCIGGFPVKGMFRFYRSTGNPIQMFAWSGEILTVNDSTGGVTSINNSASQSATFVDFASVNDKAYYVNGLDGARSYDGTTDAAIGGSPTVGNPADVEIHANCLFLLQPNTNLVVFSDPGSYETFGATSFLYIPSPKTADPVIRMVSVQGVMYFFTRNTKYLLYGTALANFVLKESPASKGAVCATAICKNENNTYFVSEDFHVYSFNGGTDTRLSSERVAAILRNLASLNDIKLYVDDKKLYVSYTPTGQTENHNRLVYDLVFNEWLNDEQVYTGLASSWNSQSDTGQLVVGSTRVGSLYYANNGNSDLGKPIAFDWWSKYMSFGSPAAKHRVKRYYPFLQGEDGNYSIDCQIDQDGINSPTSNLVDVSTANHLYGDAGLVYGSTASGGSGLTYGNGVLGPSRIAVPGSYHKTQFRFVQSGVDNPIGVLGFMVYVLPKNPR